MVFYRYVLVIVACTAILLGIQVPNFVDQYEKRLNAHFLEVSQNMAGYFAIAKRYTNGSMEALIAQHENSREAIFHAEAEPIKRMYDRYKMFYKETAAMQTNLYGKIWHVIYAGNRSLIDETYQSYTYGFVLNKQALSVGIIAVIIALILLELIVDLLLGLGHLICGRRGYRTAAK